MSPTRPLFSDHDSGLWRQHEPVIRRLYLSERRTLKEVKNIMEQKHGFPRIPLSTYETKLREDFGLRKKLKKSDWPLVHEHCQRRSREGRQSGVYVNNIQIPWKKAWKEIRRSKGQSAHDGPAAQLPAGVVVRTPSPVGFPAPRISIASGADRSLRWPTLATVSFPLTTRFDNFSNGLEVTPPVAGFWAGCGNQLHFSLQTAESSALHAMASDYYYTQAMVPSTPTLSGEQAIVAQSCRRALDVRRASFDTTPWNTFKVALRFITKGTTTAATDFFHINGHHPDFDSTKCISRVTSPESAADPLPSRFSLTMDHILFSTVPALNFDPYHFLARAMYLLSNNLLRTFPQSELDQVKDLFEIIFSQIPRGVLLQLLESDLPTVRAAWEVFVEISHEIGHKDAFSLLMSVGFRHTEWIGANGHKYLAWAAWMGAVDIVQGLLAVGFRPDDQLIPLDHDEAAILAAVAGGHMGCINLLIENCDVNRVTEYSIPELKMSNFQALIELFNVGYFSTGFKKSKISIENELHRKTLELMLSRGGDVDLPWNKKFNYLKLSAGLPKSFQLWGYYHRLQIPAELKPTILEYCFYYDPGTFEILAPHSIRDALQITRLGICLSARQSKEVLGEYLKSRPACHSIDTKQYLELILAEQFFINVDSIDVKIVRTMVEFGVDITLPSLELGVTFLLKQLVRRARMHDFDPDAAMILSLLLQEGAVIDSEAIACGVHSKGIGLLQVLLQYGAAFRDHGAKALATAARFNNHEAVAWLLDAGVDINADISMPNGQLSVIAVAITQTFNLEQSDSLYQFDIETDRFIHANFDMFRELIRHGAKLRSSRADPNHIEFLKLVLRGPEDGTILDRLQLFLDSGVDFRDLSATHAYLLEECLVSPLDHPWHALRLSAYEFLFRHGAPVNPGGSLAALILRGGRHELILEVLRAGADINAYSAHSDRSYTALQAAACQGDLDLVTLLSQKGASINQPALGLTGRTALQAACEWDPISAKESSRKMKLIRFLLDKGADANAPAADMFGYTALQIASLRGDIEISLLLLNHGADPNAPPSEEPLYDDRRSALDLAADMGRLDMVQLLLSEGAHSYSKGSTRYEGAISLAVRSGSLAVADVIRMHATKFPLSPTGLLVEFETSSEYDVLSSSSDSY